MAAQRVIHPFEVKGVFNGIVAQDDYRLRQVEGPIDTVFDFGANVGMFALAARVLFPAAYIYAFEPEPSNFATLQAHTRLWPQTTCIQAALGRGDTVYYRTGSGPSHSHHAFMTPTPTCSSEMLAGLYEAQCGIPLTTPGIFAQKHGILNLLVKIDVEGAEDCLVDDEASRVVLTKAKYICMELHFFNPATQVICDATRKRLTDWAHSFSETHTIATDLNENGGLVWMGARK